MSKKRPDPYEVLGVDRRADRDKVRRAYRRRAGETHPDRNPGDEAAVEEFKEVEWAYRLLTDETRRRRYDETGDGEKRRDRTPECVNVVVQHYMTVVNVMAAEGQDVSEVDLVKRVRQSVNQAAEEPRKAVKHLMKLRQALEESAKRLKVKDGDNLLALAVRHQVAQVEEQLGKAEAVVSGHDEACRMLDRYTYEHRKPYKGAAVTADLGTWVKMTLGGGGGGSTSTS